MTDANARSVAREVAHGTSEPAAITVRDLRMNYGATEVLRGVDLTARRGEVVALLGPNGAGKTTTIEILEGFRTRSSGEVEVLGADPARGDERWRSRVGVVMQSWRDHAAWKVRDLIDHFGRFHAPYSEPGRTRPYDTGELMASLGLTEHAHKRLRTLSGGQRRRVDVALGLVGRPELLFLDEPTTGLDPRARRDFHELIHRLTDEEDTTVLLTTHDLAEAEKLADRILILAGGRIVADGSADRLSFLVGMQSEVTWSVDGARHVHATDHPARYIAELYRVHGDGITDLKVLRPSLEEVYLDLVQRSESGDAERAAAEFAEEIR